MNAVSKIPSVNFHLWKACNMRCKFCFATFADYKPGFLPKGHLNREDCIAVVESLADAGFDKINFAGGEPTLCPWLPDLISAAKRRGMITSIVTNGTRVDDEWIKTMRDFLDWIALSIDTTDADKLTRIGRATRRGPLTDSDYLHMADAITEAGIRLKINTVVTAETWDQDFTAFIRRARPERWKVLQVLPVAGQNDGRIGDLTVTAEQFERYVERNREVERDGIAVIAESNDAMTGSYVMVDPAGRFFDNTAGCHTYSRPILEVGVESALEDIVVDAQRFLNRGGRYEW